MRRKISLSHFDEASINLTPLIDVVFVILIMFIVVAPLLEVEQIDLAAAPPSSENVSSEHKSPLVIHVYADNRITLNKESVSLIELKKRLCKAHDSYGKCAIELYHDKAACFGTYQSIKRIVEETGYLKLNVILKP